MRVLLISTLLAVVGAPVSSSFQPGIAVPLAPLVSVRPLAATAASDAAPPAAARNGDTGAVQRQALRLMGRKLTLAVMQQAAGAGTAVLSAAEGSLLPTLPQIGDQQFQALVTELTGCRPAGDVLRISGARGTLALSAGVACPLPADG